MKRGFKINTHIVDPERPALSATVSVSKINKLPFSLRPDKEIGASHVGSIQEGRWAFIHMQVQLYTCTGLLMEFFDLSIEGLALSKNRIQLPCFHNYQQFCSIIHLKIVST